MKRSVWALGVVFAHLAPPAQAQNAAPPAPSPAIDAPAKAADARDGQGSAQPLDDLSSASDDRKSPSVVQVNDPMLEPIEEAPHVLTDWRDAIERVRNQSTDFRVALAQVEAARGQSRMVLSNSLPKLIGDASISYELLPGRNFNPFLQSTTSQPYPNPRWQAGMTLTVPLLSARNWYDYATSKQEIAQREYQADDAQRLIIGGLAQAMVSVITAERLAEVTRVNLSAALSTLDLNQRRAVLGAGNAIDVLRARQEVETSRSQVVEANESVRKAREALGLALGDSQPWGITPDVKLDQLRQDARDTCKASGQIQDRADVRAAAAGAAIAERNAEAVAYSYLPTIDGRTSLTYFPNELQSANRKHVSWSIGATLTWHLYDGGRRYGEKTLNTALYEQSRQQSIQAERDATNEVRQAVRSVTVAKQSLDVALSSSQIADQNAGLARAKFLNGTGSSFDLVDTQRAARQTKLDVTVKEYELLRAEIIAYLALASCEI